MAAAEFGYQLKYVPPIIVSPEAYGLPEEMDPMAQYVTRRGGGGLGDFIRGLMTGLYGLGIRGYSISPNYKKIFMESRGLTPEEYIKQMGTTIRDRTLLVSSPHFSYLEKIYEKNVEDSAALLQELSLPLIKSTFTEHGGRAIAHVHDQYGGIITAYCKARKIPSIHTVHNGFEFLLPYTSFKNADLTDGCWGLKRYLYDTSKDSGWLYSHATSVKNADMVTFVGKRFMEEIMSGRYDNWDIFQNSQAAFNEMKIKAMHNQTRAVMNGISEEELPENQNYLKKRFNPKTKDIVAAKDENKKELQKQLGLNVNEDAILMYWPSRIDNSQKGIECLLGCAKDILWKNPDVQIAIIGDAAGNNTKYLGEINNLIQQSPKGSIAHAPFEKKLSNQGYAAASAIIGASHYEPFGLFWLQGICAGAFGIGAKNGGAVDILRDFDNENGNGVLYNNSDVEGLRYGMNTIISKIRSLKDNPEVHNQKVKKMMINARSDFSLDKMLEGYLEIYDELASRYGFFTEEYKHFIDKG